MALRSMCRLAEMLLVQRLMQIARLGRTGVHLLRFRSRAVDPIRESRQNECL